MRRKVAVIGAGPSGLAAIKACLEESLDVTCYETKDHIGGVWKYDENRSEDGTASMFQSVHMNTSRDMTAFSDFPPATHFSLYMPHAQTYRYLQMYAEHFQLMQHVKLRHKVLNIRCAPDFLASGRWLVTVVELESKIPTENVFDFVMVCVGTNFSPNVPSYADIEKFKGRTIHSRDYRTPDDFRNQRVVVVGLGSSGLDISVDLCRNGCKTYLCTQRGAWILRRAGNNGKPADAQDLTYKENFLSRILPYNVNCWRKERIIQRAVDHNLYGLKPKHRIFSQYLTISDHLHLYLLYGDIQLKPSISRFTSRGVIFKDEDEATLVDTVIWATGYQYALSHLIDSTIVDTNDPDDIYQFIFPLRPEHQTIALIGYATPSGPTIPVFEMQCRVAVQVFVNRVRLPAKDIMISDMRNKRKTFHKVFYKGYRKLTHVHWIQYFNELGSFIGVKPSLFRMLFTDPHLFCHCFFGPCLPLFFRLQGPHAWEEARSVILQYEQRISISLSSNEKVTKRDCCCFQRLKKSLFVVLSAFMTKFAYDFILRRYFS